MTDLLRILPDFPLKQYTHLIPSLEKNIITTTDLLTLDAVDVAKRAQLPTLDVRRLITHVNTELQKQLGLHIDGPNQRGDNAQITSASDEGATLRSTVASLTQKWTSISTLDHDLDAALGGGMPTGYIAEITGESGAGKTQLLLTLLLSCQLPSPHGLSRSALYISTEHPLPTSRLHQLLSTHPILLNAPKPPSLSHILTLSTPDLETQDHILTYQLPVALRTRNIGLVVIDSIAANYRAEATSLSPISRRALPRPRNGPSALAARAADLARTGALLRDLARQYDCAIVVANQVADRFSPAQQHPPPLSQQQPWTSSPSEPASQAQAQNRFMHGPERDLRYGWAVHPALSLDWQQRFFTGWGNESVYTGREGDEKGKTPALGLVWANQIACRVALVKEATWLSAGVSAGATGLQGVEESAGWAPRKWRRWMRVAFAPWAEGAGVGEKGVEFEIWSGGLRAVEGEKA